MKPLLNKITEEEEEELERMLAEIREPERKTFAEEIKQLLAS